MDPLTATMAFLRAAEQANVVRMEQCISDYPALATISGGANPALRGTTKLEAVREHAVALAHEQLTTDFKELVDSDLDPNEPERRHQKE